MSLVKARADILLLIIAAYLILDHGFMLIRLPPGGGFGIPIGELLILGFMTTFIFELRHLPHFAMVAPLVPLSIWWAVGFSRLLFDADQHGMWAFRDASHMNDTLFLWIGFVAAAAPGFLESFSKRLRLILNIGVLYYLTYPFREALEAISPKISAPAGYTATIFFNYTTAGLVPLTAAIGWLVDRKRILGLLAGALIVYCVVIFQMRTTYLQVLVLFAVLMAIQPLVAARMGVALTLGVALLALALASGLEVLGRLGEAVSLDFFIQHFAAIWGAKNEGVVGSAASGVALRLEWWTAILRNVGETAGTILFGLGYGLPLTDFQTQDGALVREPHNSLMSIIGRVGLAGLVAFAWFHLWLVRIWFRVYRHYVRTGDLLWRNNMLILGVFFLLMWVYAMGEDAFEKPFNAIPYYFMWGVVLRAYYQLQTEQVWHRGEQMLGQGRKLQTAPSL